MDEYPYVSICTPLFNRTKWLDLMIYNLKNLDYPKDKLEWCVLDTHDKKDQVWDKLFKNDMEKRVVEVIIGFKINYVTKPNSYPIGKKRNMLVKQATHKICANMDSDDLILQSWLKHSIEVMNSDKRCSLVGTPEMTFVYPHLDWKITGIRCPSKRMIHEACMVYSVKHHRSMGGFGVSSQGEGTKMIDFNENKCLPTSADKCIICVCHDENTIDKDQFKDKSMNDVVLGGEMKEVLQKILNIE